MDSVNRKWDRLTALGMRSDGVVHGPSQVYPNAMENFPVLGRDSHGRETKSKHTRDRLDCILPSEFGVAPRPKQ